MSPFASRSSLRMSRPRSILTAVAVAVAATIMAGGTAASAAPRADGAVAHAPAATGWRIIRTFGASNTTLEQITAIGKSAAWAGGSTPARTPVMYQMAGGKWHRFLLPGGTGEFVESLGATSASNAWAAIANAPGGTVERRIKTGWKSYSFPHGTDQILASGVVTFGASNTWAFELDFTAGISYGYHFNGHSWTQHVLPATPSANAAVAPVSASSPANIWALTFASGQNAALRYDGKHWQIVKFPSSLVPTGTTAYSRQILAESPSNVWASMFTVTGKHVGPILLLHWNGHKWSKVTGKLPSGSLVGAMAPDGARRALARGHQYGQHQADPAALRVRPLVGCQGTDRGRQDPG